MRRGQRSLPLAFILAMAADASAATLSDTNNKTTPLEAGTLRKLLDPTTNANMVTRDMNQSGDRSMPGEKMAQFPNFPNFFNCVRGYWRNC